jgi:hypothetical protein
MSFLETDAVTATMGMKHLSHIGGMVSALASSKESRRLTLQ